MATRTIRLKKLLFLSISTTAVLTTQLLIASPAKAQVTCEYGGQRYSPGETVGSFICGSDGNWQRND
jgi:hypothetical protein